MRAGTMCLAVLLVCIPCLPVSAEPSAPGSGAGTAESFEQAVAAAKNDRERAVLRKRFGDFYVSREDYAKAAEEFSQALTLDPSPFSDDERFTMAVTMSWAGRYDDAAAVLRALLSRSGGMKKARIHLAKVLSWSGRLDEADAVADAVLKAYPGDQDALLVKANVLRWRGNAAASIPFYEKARAQGDTFDASLGLAYAYLDTGEKGKAVEIAKSLKPQYAYQEKELAEFSDSLCVQASRADIHSSYYKDSDGNKVHRYAPSYGFLPGKWDAGLTYRLTKATDPSRNEKAEDIWITAHRQTGMLGVGMMAGINMTDSTSGSLAVGRANVDVKKGWWTVGASAAREALTETAEIIRNRIVRTSGAVSMTQAASQRLTFIESFTHSGYSDGNDADDFQAGSAYTAIFTPLRVVPGYRFRYWNFRRQSGGGYFDPEQFFSHQLSVSLSGERNGFYVSLEPFAGYQSFQRYGETTRSGFAGFFGSAGRRLKKCTSFEVNGEGGNYAGGTAVGFNYYQVGFKFTAYF